jgi:gamma-tubulin complex component 2
MLNFMQSIVYYMSYEVIEPRWHELEASLRSARNMDDILIAHGEFKKAIFDECLLTNLELLNVLNKIMVICRKFTVEVKQSYSTTRLLANF